MNENNSSSYWSKISSQTTLQILKTTVDGLSLEEAQKRISEYGYNEINNEKRFHWIKQFLKQFNNVLIYVLLLSSVITFFLGHLLDSLIILSVILINALLGVYQEGKAEKALLAIHEMLSPTALVKRSGKIQEIQATCLVPGDIVFLKNGDKVPADLRLIDIKNLQIQEDILTGESKPIEKNIDPVLSNKALGDLTSMAFSGTFVTFGKGVGVVVETGGNTEIGKISRLLKNVEAQTTPLLHSIDAFGKWLTLAIVILACFTFSVGMFLWNQSFELMFLSSVSIAVAAIPEGLPPVLTIILALGVSRMAKRNAIVRSLPAVETMGAVNVICTDKTGTLTKGIQVIQNITTLNATCARDDLIHKMIKNTAVDKIIESALLCTEAHISHQETQEKPEIHGNDIDKSLFDFAHDLNFSYRDLFKKYQQIDFLPYDSSIKMMSVLRTYSSEQNILLIKGAPEKILSLCTLQENEDAIPTQFDKVFWEQKINDLTLQGYRIFAIGYCFTPSSEKTITFEKLPNTMIFLGIIGLMDELRQEARDSVLECYRAGIDVKMITGDHVTTATTIASLVGIKTENGALQGHELETLDFEELKEKVVTIDLYARTSPEHKINLVKALQAQGFIVAMTGDGVNDAPALKQANIGIAMGKRGSTASKEAAAMVLADDNFSTIVHAIEEGRAIFDNIKKVILFLLPTNIAMSLVVVIAILCGMSLPITPLQILWINTISAVTLSIPLGFEKPEGDLMLRKPRDVNQPIITPFYTWRILLMTGLITIAVFGVFLYGNAKDLTPSLNQTICVNMLVLGEIACLLQCRHFNKSAFSWSILNNNSAIFKAFLSILFFQMVFTYVPLMQTLFKTKEIMLFEWSIILVISFVIFALLDVEKWVIRSLRIASR